MSYFVLMTRAYCYQDKEPWEGLLWYRREEVSLRVVVGIQLTNMMS